MNTKIKVQFPKGVHTLHVPFNPDARSVDRLYKEINRIEKPPRVRFIEATIHVSIDPRQGASSYTGAEVTFIK